MPVKRVELIRDIQIIFPALIITYSTVEFAYDPFDCLNDVAQRNQINSLLIEFRI